MMSKTIAVLSRPDSELKATDGSGTLIMKDTEGGGPFGGKEVRVTEITDLPEMLEVFASCDSCAITLRGPAWFWNKDSCVHGGTYLLVEMY